MGFNLLKVSKRFVDIQWTSKIINKFNIASKSVVLIDDQVSLSDIKNNFDKDIDNKIDPYKIDQIGRAGGSWYTKMKKSFGEHVINSYLKLRKSEIEEFKKKEIFDKTKPITKWEKANTLDC